MISNCKYCTEQFNPSRENNVVCPKCATSSYRKNKYKIITKPTRRYFYRMLIEEPGKKNTIINETGSFASKQLIIHDIKEQLKKL